MPRRGRVGQPSGAHFFAEPVRRICSGLKVGRRSVEMVLTDFLGPDRRPGKERKSTTSPISTGCSRSAWLQVPRSVPARAIEPPPHRRHGDRHAVPPLEAGPSRSAWLRIAWPTGEPRGSSCRTGRDASTFLFFLRNECHSSLQRRTCLRHIAQAKGTFFCFFVAFFIGGGLVLRGSLFTGFHRQCRGSRAARSCRTGTAAWCRSSELASLSTLERQLAERGLDPMHIWDRADGWDLPMNIPDWLDRRCRSRACTRREGRPDAAGPGRDPSGRMVAATRAGRPDKARCAGSRRARSFRHSSTPDIPERHDRRRRAHARGGEPATQRALPQRMTRPTPPPRRPTGSEWAAGTCAGWSTVGHDLAADIEGAQGLSGPPAWHVPAGTVDGVPCLASHVGPRPMAANPAKPPATVELRLASTACVVGGEGLEPPTSSVVNEALYQLS